MSGQTSAQASATSGPSTGPEAGVAGRYASALFDLAKEAGAVGAVESELKALAGLIEGSADLRAFLKSPVYEREDQNRVASALAERAGFSQLTANFMKLLAQNGRLFALPAVIKSFLAMAAADRGEVSAEAITAAPMNEEQSRALRHEIEAMAGKAVNLETRVDPELLGGLVVKVGSRMIDASLKTKLNRLKTVMKEA